MIMGFNYERDVGCMLENFGHRTESIMSAVYRNHQGERNMWDFCRYDRITPGRASCGNVHFAPSSTSDYDWGNPRVVQSDCDDRYSYPNCRVSIARSNAANGAREICALIISGGGTCHAPRAPTMGSIITGGAYPRPQPCLRGCFRLSPALQAPGRARCAHARFRPSALPH